MIVSSFRSWKAMLSMDKDQETTRGRFGVPGQLLDQGEK
jgi:hypothetical protein